MLDDRIRSAVESLRAVQAEAPDIQGVRTRVHRRRGARTLGLFVAVGAAVLVFTLWPSSRSTRVNVSPIDGPQPATGSGGSAYSGVLPPGRGDGVMAFDPASGQLILFGGIGMYGTLGDTWSWNGHNWSLLHPLHSPPAQSKTLMGYDPQSRRLILIGGEVMVPLTDPCRRPAGAPVTCQPASVYRGVGLTNDTWTWDGTDWTDLALPPMPANAQVRLPSPGQDQVVTDSATGSLLLVDEDRPALWRWSPAGWQTIHSAHVPPSGDMVAAADPVTGGVLAVDEPRSVIQRMPELPTQTWKWNGHDWVELHPAAQPGAPYFMAQLDASVTVLSGSAQWLWKHGDWQRQSSKVPMIGDGAQVATDTLTGQLVALGGWPSPTLPASSAMTIETGVTWTSVTLPTSPTPIPVPTG